MGVDLDIEYVTPITGEKRTSKVKAMVFPTERDDVIVVIPYA